MKEQAEEPHGDLAARLRALRADHGLSQEDAARKIGVTTRQWQRWEKGGEPKASNVRQLAEAFGWSADEVVGSTSRLDRIEEMLTGVDEKLERILNDQSQDGELEPQTAEEALDELRLAARTMQALLDRLGRDFGLRDLQSRRGKGRPPEAPPAAA